MMWNKLLRFEVADSNLFVKIELSRRACPPYTGREFSCLRAQPLLRSSFRHPGVLHARGDIPGMPCGFALVGPWKGVLSLREPTPPIATFGAKRRSTRLAHAVPLLVSWTNSPARTVTDEAATVSISCHGFRYFSRQRPPKNASITFQILVQKEDKSFPSPIYPGRVAWARKSRRLDGLHLVGVEFAIPLNIWDVEEVPEDWEEYWTPAAEESATFLSDVDRFLNSAKTANHYELLDVKADTPRSEVKRHFYKLARRFHPDHHMDHPEWTPCLSALMERVTAAYKTLSDEEAKKQYDLLLARGTHGDPSDSPKQPYDYLKKAQECMSEKNFAGCILWLHRAIECEPQCSGHRAMLGRCLSAIPEYRREAAEQFEMAIQLDPGNVAAHFHYGELLEHLRAPWRAQAHYLRVLELDANHREAREHLTRLNAGAPRAAAKKSLLRRLTGRR